jgi:hypothetical protein
MYLGSVEIFSHKAENFVRFPDDNSEWSFSIGQEHFNSIMKQHKSLDDILYRKVRVVYSSFGSSENFEYVLTQSIFLLKINGKMLNRRRVEN